MPRKCPGTAGEFRSCLVPFRVWESLVRARSPPLVLPKLQNTEWQIGSSRSLAASRKPASLPKVVAASGSSQADLRLKLVPEAAAAAAAAAATVAAVAAQPPKLHTRGKGGTRVEVRKAERSTNQPPHSGMPSFSSGGHSLCAQSCQSRPL